MNANDQFYRILRSIFLTTGHAAVTLCQIRRVVVFAHRDRALDSLATRYNNNPRLAYVGLFAFPITRNSRVFRSVPRCTDLLKQIMPWLFVGWTIVDVSIVGIRATRSQPRTSAAAKLGWSRTNFIVSRPSGGLSPATGFPPLWCLSQFVMRTVGVMYAGSGHLYAVSQPFPFSRLGGSPVFVARSAKSMSVVFEGPGPPIHEEL